jgi:hypothetical protein
MPRPSFKPTTEQKKIVEVMSGFGIQENAIASTIGVAPKTLRKHFRRELDNGITTANAAVIQSLFRSATSGKCPAAAMFWVKCRAGWRETTVLQHTGPNGGPVEVTHANLDQRITDALASIARSGDLEKVPGPAETEREDGSGVSVEELEGPPKSTRSGG